MGLRMKNLNIFGVHWKIGFLGGSSWKNQYRGRNHLKKGAWMFLRFKGWGAWHERGAWCFWGGIDTPMHLKYTTWKP